MASKHIVLTSHPRGGSGGHAPTIRWGAATALERGPVVASLTNTSHRNAIGTHSGAYALYRALAVASGTLDRDHRPDGPSQAPGMPSEARHIRDEEPETAPRGTPRVRADSAGGTSRTSPRRRRNR
jgi:hypothetical protein